MSDGSQITDTGNDLVTNAREESSVSWCSCTIFLFVGLRKIFKHTHTHRAFCLATLLVSTAPGSPVYQAVFLQLGVHY